jgi:hypothetical protein
MSEPLTPEEMRAKIVAELKARPGPQPLKPIPPEIMAELLADQLPYEEAEREYKELMEKGGLSFEQVLEAFDRAAERPNE